MAKSLRFIHCGDLHLGSPFHDIAMVDERWQRIVGKAPVRPAHGVHSSCDPAWRGAALFVRRADSDGRVQFYSFKDTEKPCFSVFYAYI